MTRRMGRGLSALLAGLLLGVPVAAKAEEAPPSCPYPLPWLSSPLPVPREAEAKWELRVYARPSPHPDTPLLGRIAPGAAVTVLFECNVWRKLRAGELVGWAVAVGLRERQRQDAGRPPGDGIQEGGFLARGEAEGRSG